MSSVMLKANSYFPHSGMQFNPVWIDALSKTWPGNSQDSYFFVHGPLITCMSMNQWGALQMSNFCHPTQDVFGETCLCLCLISQAATGFSWQPRTHFKMKQKNSIIIKRNVQESSIENVQKQTILSSVPRMPLYCKISLSQGSFRCDGPQFSSFTTKTSINHASCGQGISAEQHRICLGKVPSKEESMKNESKITCSA